MLSRQAVKRLAWLGCIALVLLLVPLFLTPSALPDRPSEGASIKIYGANVWGFRGYFAIHTWVATRTANEDEYQIDQVIGWRLQRTGSALVSHVGQENAPWFGNKALLLHEISGAEAEALIPRVREAVLDYPYAREYTMFPGPNSNSFTEWVALEGPELELNLPVKAIGRLWMRHNFTKAR